VGGVVAESGSQHRSTTGYLAGYQLEQRKKTRRKVKGRLWWKELQTSRHRPCVYRWRDWLSIKHRHSENLGRLRLARQADSYFMWCQSAIRIASAIEKLFHLRACFDVLINSTSGPDTESLIHGQSFQQLSFIERAQALGRAGETTIRLPTACTDASQTLNKVTHS